MDKKALFIELIILRFEIKKFGLYTKLMFLLKSFYALKFKDKLIIERSISFFIFLSLLFMNNSLEYQLE